MNIYNVWRELAVRIKAAYPAAEVIMRLDTRFGVEAKISLSTWNWCQRLDERRLAESSEAINLETMWARELASRAIECLKQDRPELWRIDV